MKELYNAPKAEVISFVSEQPLAAWGGGNYALSININFLEDTDSE